MQTRPAAERNGRRVVPVPAEVPAVLTTIEVVTCGYRATAVLQTKATESSLFRSRTQDSIEAAYAAAKRFLSRFERSCPLCRTHYAYGDGARCECGACEGGDADG